MQIAVLGIDLGKNGCSVVGLDTTDCAVLKRSLHHDDAIELAAGMPDCLLAIKACCRVNHLSRILRDQGHQVRLMPPGYVRPLSISVKYFPKNGVQKFLAENEVFS